MTVAMAAELGRIRLTSNNAGGSVVRKFLLVRLLLLRIQRQCNKSSLSPIQQTQFLLRRPQLSLPNKALERSP